uniref:NADH-ubiquinone oxidoreductase chain 3 n=3 Tax=Echinococcus TaxID=6209 RepID=A0A2Z4GQ50_9CEST|nr:NADH dehydrogenase subunit 3 [Echinococcus canadensis]YP_009505043.1 NADH dehydrogenase subunit 3 [Echinococcus granulosus sensu lato genotype G6]YP_009505055.1 NADH dehydrogenase subunit 3 [Echinococcus granulosus sensu lato genotype G7]AHG97576.1 NADH dehydrogenase subunit 3 [Echinococcus canadensis]AHH81840.1 NADH dehydrogenase subunit 3 [Echinococcus canadensis]AHH81841.1 NADH dehydrogenase subunit 3 [Echinococcus canadensis]AWW03414.1 NADH dehydrogenase subunit 3 [Echinococcus granulo
MVVLFFVFFVFFLLGFVIYFFNCGLLDKFGVLGFEWCSSYECGFFPAMVSLDCFSFTYFLLLVVFVIFDLEISLLLNMPFQGVLFDNFWYYYFFLLVMFFGFVVELFSGYVRWVY